MDAILEQTQMRLAAVVYFFLFLEEDPTAVVFRRRFCNGWMSVRLLSYNAQQEWTGQGVFLMASFSHLERKIVTGFSNSNKRFFICIGVLRPGRWEIGTFLWLARDIFSCQLDQPFSVVGDVEKKIYLSLIPCHTILCVLRGEMSLSARFVCLLGWTLGHSLSGERFALPLTYEMLEPLCKSKKIISRQCSSGNHLLFK